ncbi:SH3 domain-containing protein [Streptomyces cathayae]|uniref:SH3 domain-containing protein n=1 Tax=Streptomyces cathayae TaxID=3031124 RepID=A0ABY8JVG8_9ACTN|nr:SH3 domain-containing protein [Streptomyces sp. HUAS 5]WGD39781.1 SH3 domain-containing protein [Streptomyces sp. HUAS 5]
MRSSRIALSAAVLGALALPLVSATAATAAPASAPSMMPTTRACDRPDPWGSGTQAVDIRSKASVKSTRLGILHRDHRFTVHKTSGNRHHITDTTTGSRGWGSGPYVYRDVRMCLG